jgi:methylenetetrahydrofolate dehydrogenase (NADP+) / methenyltetrahydrofolate cyclohydrolase
MAEILNGKQLAKGIHKQIKQKVAQLDEQPVLAVLLIGKDPASHTYVRIKEEECRKAGIGFELFLYPSDEPEENLINTIDELNKCNDVHGILVQLPLPSQNADKIIAAIDPTKDVDGFHRINIDKLKNGDAKLVSAVAMGVMRLIGLSGTHLREKQTVVVASDLFAEPIVELLHHRHANVTVLHADDAELGKKTKKADVLITAVGKPELITGAMIKKGAIVIDVGTTRVSGHIVGDVEFESANLVAKAITPVPGGVGPMTVAMLLENILIAYELNK